MKSRILGNFQPTSLDKDTILAELTAEVERLYGTFRSQYWTVRNPYQHDQGKSGTAKWHTDGPYRMYMIIWANEHPIETQSDLVIQDGDIVLWYNLQGKHRTPKLPDGHNRWFARFFKVESNSFTVLGQEAI